MVPFGQVANAIDVFSSMILAIFTIVLASSTRKYSKQSKEQTDEIAAQTEEMVATRKLKHEPRMKATIRCYHNPNFCISFVNIGGGIAQNVHAEYWIEGADESYRDWKTQIHFPEEMYDVGFPLDDVPTGVTGPSSKILSHLEDEKDTLIVNWSYEDASGKSLGYEQEFSISDELNGRTDTDEFFVGKERETSI